MKLFGKVRSTLFPLGQKVIQNPKPCRIHKTEDWKVKLQILHAQMAINLKIKSTLLDLSSQ